MTELQSRSQWFASIRAKLLAWFLLIALGSVGIVAVLASSLARASLEKATREHLATLAETRAVQIEELADARVAAVAALARDPSLVDAFAAYGGGTAPGEELEQFLGTLAQGLELASLALVDMQGTVVESFGELGAVLAGRNLFAEPWQGGPLSTAIERSAAHLQADLSALQRIPGRRRPALFVVGPVLDGPRVVGILVAQIDEAPIDAAIGDVSGLGATGQTVAVSGEGGMMMVAAPLRSDPDAAGVRRLEGERHRLALRGDGGVGYGIGPDGQEVIGAWFHLPALRWSVSVEQNVDEAFAPAREQAQAILTVAALMVIPVALAALWVASSLSRPIRGAASGLVRAASGDLSSAPPVEGSGEVRGLLESLRRMVQDLGSMLVGVRGTGRELASMSGEVRETASRQHSVVQDLSSSAAEVTAAVEQMSVTGRQLAATAGGVAELADETSSRASRGREGLDRMREAIGSLAETSAGVSGRLAEIRDRAEGVGAVIGTITRVASRTNLLSINAAIEAEKAGAHGRGFQVVATEINRLADETAGAALEVETIIEAMQASVTAGAGAMSGLEGVMRSGVETASSVADDLAAILEAIGSLRDRFTELKGGIEAQSEGAMQIRDAMRQLASSAETARSIVERLRTAGDRLESSASELTGSVDRFKLPEA